jgi:hypothetical protein
MAAITFKFDNRALRALPVESEARNFVRQVSNACFSRVRPTPVTNPQLIAYSPACVRLIGIQPEVIEANRDYAANVFAGNIVPDGADPAAQCYCGHQFGSFAGQLGDGAAILIGEVVGELGRYELQIKGAGPTPYSRTADGRKVLRSSLREFVCSEAMWGLGIPSTRAATLVTSDTTVERDPMYTGRIINERCSIVSRVAETFIRFGSFEIALVEGHNSDRHGPSPGNTPLIRTLFDFVATQYYAAVPADPNSSPFRPPRRSARRGRPQHPHGDHSAHGVPRCRLAVRGLRARRAQHGQHEHHGADHRLRPVRFHGLLRHGHDPQLVRRRRPLPLREPTGAVQVELPAAGGGVGVRGGTGAMSGKLWRRRCGRSSRNASRRPLTRKWTAS